MRARDIVKLVFVIVLTVIAVLACILALTLRFQLQQEGETVEGKEAIGFVFAAMFGYLFAVLAAILSWILNVVSVILCIFGLHSPVGRVKITFLVFLIVNCVSALVAGLGTFAGL